LRDTVEKVDAMGARFPPRGNKRYLVCAQDMFEEPASDSNCRQVGEFDSADEALSCARAIVDKSMEEFSAWPTTEDMILMFRTFGEGATVYGEPAVSFNSLAYANERAVAIDRSRLISRL
jgi:hypothetical protein